MTIDEQIEFLCKGCVHVVERDELKERLTKSKDKGKPLTVKAGFDPSAPDIHLGHTVLLRKMKHFQDIGHRVIFLIGDFTGMVGDPSGKKATRPQLTRGEILKNAETYKEQVFKILDSKKTEIRFNSEWLAPMNFNDIALLSSRMSVARMLERNDFSDRYKNGVDISILEFLYPLMQSYDSVALKCDVELGGEDQLFNLLMGRTIQKRYGQEGQIVMTVPLLEGTDGKEKMSKSLGNYIGINETPEEIYGKVMSISDELMWKYYLLCTDKTPSEIDNIKNKIHPMEAKRRLAFEITSSYHTRENSMLAQENFNKQFSKREIPSEIEEFAYNDNEPPLAKLLSRAAKISTSAAQSLIRQGAVRKIPYTKIKNPEWQNISERVEDCLYRISDSEQDILVKVGKRKWIRLKKTNRYNKKTTCFKMEAD